MKKDFSISLYRVIATLFILLCHIGTHYGSGLVSMGFLVGVEMFLLLSGYLAAKGIHKTHDWRYLIKRYWRMMLPVWILLVIYMIPALILQRNAFADFLPYLGGVFGLPRLHGADYFPKVQGLTHLWYITVALLCEVVALPVLLLKRRFENPRPLYYAVALPALVVLYVLGGLTPIRFDYVLVFAAGILLFDLLQKKTTWRGFLLCGAVLVAAVAVRLVGMRYIDGTHFYTNTVIPLTYFAIALSLFVIVRFLVEGPLLALCQSLQKSRVIGFLETHSYEIYISHYIFIVGPLCVYALSVPEIVKNLLFLVCSLAAAALLHFLVRQTNRWCKR